MTKVEAVKALLEKLGGQATWQQINEGIEEFYPQAKLALIERARALEFNFET